MEDDPMGKQIRGKNAAAKKKTQEKEEEETRTKREVKNINLKLENIKIC